MSEHTPGAGERHVDVAVVGGSASGLAAALQLGRQRRSVVVIDAGEPRNAPAAHMHGYLGHEGLAPAELTAIGRDEVRRHGVEVIPGRVVDVTRPDDHHFRVHLAGGHALIARRVLAATGLVDELPDIDGLSRHWGDTVIHCPFCHGYEVRDRRIVQIVTHPMGLHPASLFRHLTADLTLVLHDGVDPHDPEVEQLRAAGATVVDQPAQRVLTGEDGRLSAVELVDGTRIDAEIVAVGPRFRVRAQPFASLGLRTTEHPSGLGDVVETDATGATPVPGLYAAGNVTDPSQQVLHAAAHGSRVGAMISFSLAHDDLTDAARPSAVEHDWDRRYGGDRLWSGKPNGTLVREVEGLPTGRALDVGAGEGGDAAWLADRGWEVTASDISERALDHVAALARERTLPITCRRADVNALDPFEADAFDLVSAQYVPIPRSPDHRGIDNLVRAVAPGGTLLVVNHDPEALRRRIGHDGHGPLIDPDALVGIDDFAARIGDSTDWRIEVHERRARPGGAASPHVDDVVLRAHRRR